MEGLVAAFDPKITALGFAVSVLVGMTGVGAAAITTPVLVLVFGIKPILAVGTDIVYSFVTKSAGAWQHFKQKNVDMRLALYLASGSIPGSLIGIRILWYVRDVHGDVVNAVTAKLLGIALIAAAVMTVVRFFRNHGEQEPCGLNRKGNTAIVISCGFVVGLLVGTTSVGSGTLVIAVLSLLCIVSPSKMVGTDVFHAVILLGPAASGHLASGNVDGGVLLSLLAGSIPGVLLGSRLTVVLPQRVLRVALAAVVLVCGLKLI